jgi:hypothetical protein
VSVIIDADLRKLQLSQRSLDDSNMVGGYQEELRRIKNKKN